MALQTALRRAQAQDEARAVQLGFEVDPKIRTPVPQPLPAALSVHYAFSNYTKGKKEEAIQVIQASPPPSAPQTLTQPQQTQQPIVSTANRSLDEQCDSSSATSSAGIVIPIPMSRKPVNDAGKFSLISFISRRDRNFDAFVLLSITAIGKRKQQSIIKSSIHASMS